MKNLLILGCFFTIVSVFFTPAYASSICYDVNNPNHKCPQNTPVLSEENPSHNTDMTQKASLRRVTLSSLKQACPIKNTQTAQNIIDIHQIIESTELEDNEKFICSMFTEVQKQNAKIKEERRFMLEYIRKKQSQQAISKEDKVQMTALLIKYRLMENKDGFCSTYKTGETCYFAGTRFSAPQEMQNTIQHYAEKYVEQFGDGPRGCVINNARHNNLEDCAKEIKLRVGTLPAPLILAQITQESGWGKSRWAKDYNNFLGLQHKFNNPETMICYKNCRCAGTQNNRCAMKFKSITGCLYEYYGRFNASPMEGYSNFRKARKALPHQDDINTQCQTARELIYHLTMYAEDKNYQNHICSSINTKICQTMKKCPPFQIKLSSL